MEGYRLGFFISQICPLSGLHRKRHEALLLNFLHYFTLRKHLAPPKSDQVPGNQKKSQTIFQAMESVPIQRVSICDLKCICCDAVVVH